MFDLFTELKRVNLHRTKEFPSEFFNEKNVDEGYKIRLKE